MRKDLKIIILGKNGMLGNAVFKYLKDYLDIKPIEINYRYPDNSFFEEIKNSSPDFIINCIGVIPQKKPQDTEYKLINTDLPIELDKLGYKIIHPSTDCEFSGNIPKDMSYLSTDRMDATDMYGLSKVKATEYILENGKNTKILRTSIIGHENNNSYSLLDWFLSQNGEVRGYSNHLWNGITTLEWAMQAVNLIDNWDDYKTLTQIGTKDIHSKYDILCIAKDVYNKNILINDFETENTVNKTLVPDIITKPLKEQLEELKQFYNK